VNKLLEVLHSVVNVAGLGDNRTGELHDLIEEVATELETKVETAVNAAISKALGAAATETTAAPAPAEETPADGTAGA
jgi:hypothetical protein